MIALIVGGAFLLLAGVLLYACRRQDTEQPEPSPDSFELELYGRWPADHKFIRQ
jgi:hypothetical protein